MKVLEITELYPPDIGGTQRHVALQAAELVRRGHHVTVLTHALPGSPAREVTPEGITVLRTEPGWLSRLPGIYQNPHQRYSPPFPEPRTFRVIRDLIKQERPDVILAHNWIVYSYLLHKKAGDPPVILTLHDYSAICHKRSLLYAAHNSRVNMPCPGPRLGRCISCGHRQYGWLKSALLATGLQLSRRLLRPKIDRVIAVSSAVSTVSQIAFAEAIPVIPCFLREGLKDVALSQPLPAFCPEGDYLLFVGSLGKHKGLHVLLEAHHGLKRRVPLVVIGTGSLQKALNVGEDVRIVLDVDHDQVMAAWAHCTIGVIPSVWEEPWGQVAAEAATVGKPVVATRVGGLQDVVLDGETGILVPPNDSRALREAIDLLMASPELRAQMGQRAEVHIRPFTASVVTDEIERVMRDVIAS